MAGYLSYRLSHWMETVTPAGVAADTLFRTMGAAGFDGVSFVTLNCAAPSREDGLTTMKVLSRSPSEMMLWLRPMMRHRKEILKTVTHPAVSGSTQWGYSIRVLRFVPLMLWSTTLFAQSLQVPASSADRGAPGTFLITLKSPAGKSPVALQWTLTAPAELMVETSDIRAGMAAESAEKFITCAVSKKPSPRSTAYICILAGGRKTIADGPIATVKYRIREGTHSGAVTVRVENVLGVSTETAKMNLDNVEGTITVR